MSFLAQQEVCQECRGKGFTWLATGVLAYGDYGPEEFVPEPCICEYPPDAATLTDARRN
jgi:hypothetical protein